MGNIIAFLFPDTYFKNKIKYDIEMNIIINEDFIDNDIFLSNVNNNFGNLKINSIK